jgi:hypothetical protein
MTLSDVTLVALKHAAWHPGRRVPTTAFSKYISRRGLIMFAEAARFLEEFGDLLINYKNRNFPNKTEELLINPCRIGSGFGADDYARAIGQAVCPVGVLHRWEFALLIAEDGSVYQSSEGYLGYLGWCGNDALEAICTARPLQPPVLR